MDKEKDILDDIFADDSLGLLKSKPKEMPSNPLLDKFLQINNFYKKHGRTPEKTGSRIERSLANQLENIQNNNKLIKELSSYDEYNLLEDSKEHMDENANDPLAHIFNADDFGLLDIKDENNILNVRESLKPVRKRSPAYVAKRKQCDDFNLYKPLFAQCHAEIEAGKRKVIPFQNEQEIEKGLFFILKGILLYVADMGERVTINGKTNARLRCIFDNGTESDMLLRSLSSELYKNGRRVTEKSGDTFEPTNKATEYVQKTGYIYILKSLSENTQVQSIDNLYKIGFSANDVHERIKNAKQEPTYLMSDVRLVKKYDVYNINAFKFEQLLQRFFSEACIELSVVDNQGIIHRPREWFSIPLEVIEQAIPMICSGDILNYKYNHYDETIELSD